MNFPEPSPFGISMYFVRLFGAGCKTGILVGVAPAPALRPAGGVADGFEIDELEGLKNSSKSSILSSQLPWWHNGGWCRSW